MTKNKSMNFLLQTLGCFISAAGIYSFLPLPPRSLSPALRASAPFCTACSASRWV